MFVNMYLLEDELLIKLPQMLFLIFFDRQPIIIKIWKMSPKDINIERDLFEILISEHEAFSLVPGLKILPERFSCLIPLIFSQFNQFYHSFSHLLLFLNIPNINLISTFFRVKISKLRHKIIIVKIQVFIKIYIFWLIFIFKFFKKLENPQFIINLYFYWNLIKISILTF